MRIWSAIILVITLAGLTPRPAAAQYSTCSPVYTVQLGDTMYSIAEKCGINPVVLININYEISDPNSIRPGQKIRTEAEIPLDIDTAPVTGAPIPGGLEEDGVYVVKPGDALGRIAMYYNTTVAEIYRVNPQLNHQPIVIPGQRIQLPPDARHQQGWVGIDRRSARYYTLIQARAADFPPNSPIDFRLRYIFGGDYAYTPEEADDTYYMVIKDAVTDARGEAFATLRVPYWAYAGEFWAVEVVGERGAQEIKARSAPIEISD